MGNWKQYNLYLTISGGLLPGPELQYMSFGSAQRMSSSTPKDTQQHIGVTQLSTSLAQHKSNLRVALTLFVLPMVYQS